MSRFVDRAREVTANISDDYFSDDTILFYLNKTQQKIVAYLIQLEQNRNKSLRALDSLRQYKDLPVTGLGFTDLGNYYKTEVQFPDSPDDINQFSYLSYDVTGVMRELSHNNRSKLDWGNLSPTDDEVYYLINKNSSDQIVFEVFTNEDDSLTSKNIRVFYILKPTKIQVSDEETQELPERLENALIYGAAEMIIMQESKNDEIGQAATKIFGNKYQEELTVNAY